MPTTWSSVPISTSAASFVLGSGWSFNGSSYDYSYVGGVDYIDFNSPGTGYVVGDLVTITGGVHGDGNAVFRVDAIDGSGGITGAAITVPGTNYLLGGEGGVTTTGGHGTGAQVAEFVDILAYLGTLVTGNGYGGSTGTTYDFVLSLTASGTIRYQFGFGDTFDSPTTTGNAQWAPASIGANSSTPNWDIAFWSIAGTSSNITAVSIKQSTPTVGSELVQFSHILWTDIPKPSNGSSIIYGGTPIGLLLALTYANTVIVGGNWIDVPTNPASWTNIQKAT